MLCDGPGDMLSDIVGMLWIKAKEKNLAFKVDVSPDLPVELLFLLTVLLDPIPPLSEVPLANTLSEPVWCLEPYHTSL